MTPLVVRNIPFLYWRDEATDPASASERIFPLSIALWGDIMWCYSRPGTLQNSSSDWRLPTPTELEVLPSAIDALISAIERAEEPEATWE